jgi:hypothetical protein
VDWKLIDATATRCLVDDTHDLEMTVVCIGTFDGKMGAA